MADRYDNKFVKIVSWFNGFPDNVDYAITIGENSTLYSCCEEDVGVLWRKHENVHKEQYKRLGWLWFVISYTYEYIAHGYDDNKYEIEAGRD